MATYTIRYYLGDSLYSEETRKRRDAAGLLFLSRVYDMIKANACLDTKSGHRAYKQAQQIYNRDVNEMAVSLFDCRVTFN